MGRLFGILTLALLVACDVSFPDEFLVEDLRVLDLRIEPPEVPLFVRGATLTFAPNELPALDLQTVQVTALVAHPDLSARFSYRWIQCGAHFASGPCPASEQERLTEFPTEELEFSPAQLIAAAALKSDDPARFITGFSSDPRALINGFYAHINLNVRVASASVSVDTVDLDATKRLVVFDSRLVATAIATAQDIELPMIEGLETPTLCKGASPERLRTIETYLKERSPNVGPTHDRIDMRLLEGATTATQAVPLDGSLELRAGETVEFRGAATPVETYQLIDNNCELRTFVERLAYSWFTTAGVFSRQLTTDNQPMTRYTAPSADAFDEPEKRVRIWTVVRDGRGGSDHRAIDLRITR